MEGCFCEAKKLTALIAKKENKLKRRLTDLPAKNKNSK
jgi:hypothetical protein